MEKLVLQAVEEVALEGPEGDLRPRFTQSHHLRCSPRRVVAQAVPLVNFGSCWKVACRQKSLG